MPTLFVVATPIGNLEDITLRALRILSEVDLIAAEDTRHTKILLTKYNIHAPLTSYHKFNIKAKTPHIIKILSEGKNVALVSDSGMPGISDPGYELIRAAIEAGIKVEAVPGASAAITALAVSGLATERFVFEGFLPKKPGKRKKLLKLLKDESRTIIIYESPFRILKLLIEISEIMGNRQIAVCRELTKKFEEVVRGKVDEVLSILRNQKILGEFVVVIEGGAR